MWRIPIITLPEIVTTFSFTYEAYLMDSCQRLYGFRGYPEKDCTESILLSIYEELPPEKQTVKKIRGIELPVTHFFRDVIVNPIDPDTKYEQAVLFKDLLERTIGTIIAEQQCIRESSKEWKVLEDEIPYDIKQRVHPYLMQSLSKYCEGDIIANMQDKRNSQITFANTCHRVQGLYDLAINLTENQTGKQSIQCLKVYQSITSELRFLEDTLQESAAIIQGLIERLTEE